MIPLLHRRKLQGWRWLLDRLALWTCALVLAIALSILLAPEV